MTTQTLGVNFRYSQTIGRHEFRGPGFKFAWAMARGAGDLLYVASRGTEYRPDEKRITKFTIGEEYLGEFAKGGDSSGESEQTTRDGVLFGPTAIALDKDGNVYVADEWLNRISIFTEDGEWLGKWGVPGDRDGEINGPSGLAFDSSDNLYLVDNKNNRIQKFTKDGQFLAKWGREGTDDGEFNLPWGIDIDKQDNVYVVDWRNDRIQKFTSDGRFLMQFGASGTGDGEFDRPTSVAVDKDGIIYVTDWLNDRLQVFDRNGSFVTNMTGDATLSKWAKEKLDANPETWKEREIAHGLEREKLFWGPVAVDVDDQNRIFVLESLRDRIQVYQKLPTYFLGLYAGARL